MGEVEPPKRQKTPDMSLFRLALLVAASDLLNLVAAIRHSRQTQPEAFNPSVFSAATRIAQPLIPAEQFRSSWP